MKHKEKKIVYKYVCITIISIGNFNNNIYIMTGMSCKINGIEE